MTDTLDRVKKVAAKHLGFDVAEIADTSNFTDDLGADSLDIVELVMAFEEEFGVSIEDHEAEFATVADAVALIDSKRVPA